MQLLQSMYKQDYPISAKEIYTTCCCIIHYKIVKYVFTTVTGCYLAYEKIFSSSPKAF
jgi:hypothetical protein